MDDRLWLQAERDRREIEEVIKRYFLAIDRGDPALQDQVFAPDGRLWVDGRIIRGPGAVPMDGPPAGIDGTVEGFNHVLGQSVISLDGDRAEAESNAVAYLVMAGTPRRLLVRGLRYLDRFVRTSAGWRIADRRHNLDWMFEAPAAIVVPLGDRVQLADFRPDRD